MILCPDEHCAINLHQVNNFTLFQNVKASGKEIRVDYSLDTREYLIELFQPFYMSDSFPFFLLFNCKNLNVPYFNVLMPFRYCMQLFELPECLASFISPRK